LTVLHAAPTTGPSSLQTCGLKATRSQIITRMKKISRLKKAAPLILLGLLLDHSPVSPRAQALVGGPFDNNTFPGVNADGTYSGTISGRNLIGIVTFGVSSTTETNGRFSVFHEGFVHYGAATGIADLQSRRVAGSLLGVAALGGAGFPTTQVGSITVVAADGSSVTNPTIVSVPSTGVSETQGGSGSLSFGIAQTLTVRTALEGAFDARMKGFPQSFKFEGEGRLSTNANTAIVATPTNGGPAGYTVTYSSTSSPQTQTDSPTPDTNTSPTGGNITADVSPQRAILRSETPFKIRGSRTSRQVYAAINAYTATQPISLTANTPIPGSGFVNPTSPAPIPNP